MISAVNCSERDSFRPEKQISNSYMCLKKSVIKRDFSQSYGVNIAMYLSCSSMACYYLTVQY